MVLNSEGEGSAEATTASGLPDSPPRVLVVDDNHATRTILEARLRTIGCRPWLAASAEEALALLRQAEKQPCDLILLDQQLPGLSGTDFLDLLRDDDPDVPVVLMTAHASVPLVTEFMRRRADGRPGGTDVLEKPIPREPLFGTLIKSAIEDGAERRRAARAEAEAERLRRARAAEQELFLNSLPYPALFLDGAGRVLTANEAYRSPRFRGIAKIGDDYPQLCWRNEPGEPAAQYLWQVLAGTRNDFSLRFPRERTGEISWWRMHACRPQGGNAGAIVSFFDITLEVETQESLRKTQQRLATLATHLPVSAIMFREEGTTLRVTFARGAALGAGGTDPARLEAQTVRAVFPDAEGQGLLDDACRRALAGEAHEFEHTHDGRSYLVQTLPVWDEAGCIGEGLCVCTDITSLQQARAEAARNARLAERVIASSFGIFVYDLTSGRHVFQNAEFGRITGWSLERLNRLSKAEVWTRVHPDDQAVLQAHFAALGRATEGEVRGLEYRFRTPDGAWRWLASRDAVFERAADGQVTQIIGTVVDITDRRRAEAERHDLGTKQARLLQHLSEGVLMIEGDGQVISANRAAHALFGYHTGDLVGRPIAEILPMATAWTEGSGIQAFLDDPHPNRSGDEGVVLARRKDGRSIPVTITFTGVSEGESTMVMALVSDASAEEARRQAETRAGVAEQARRISEALVINVMHQLGNHLQDLITFLRLIGHRWRKGKADAEEALADAVAVAVAMTSSFERMQALVRIEAGTARLVQTPVPCALLILQAIQAIEHKAAEAGLAVHIDESEGVIAADAGLMMEVIRNLLSNAVKFLDDPDGRIHVGAHALEAEVELWVADTGPGVPDDEHEIIFHPLYRGREVRDGSIPGTGVGLAIAARVVALHGGRLWVEHNLAAATPDNPRGGAVFRMRLPAAQEDAGA